MKDEQQTLQSATSQGTRPSSTLVVGLGNPILGDDGVGWKVMEQVYLSLAEGAGVLPATRYSSIETDCISLGGLSLMERILGYQRVVIVDSMDAGQGPEGSVRVFPLTALMNPMQGHTASVHDASLITALETAKAMGLPIPSAIDIVAIEARNVYDFSETLSPAVAAAVPVAVQAVMDLLKEEL